MATNFGIPLCLFAALTLTPAVRAAGEARPMPSGPQAARVSGSVYERWLSEHFRAPRTGRTAPGARAAFTSLAITSLEVSSDTGAGSFIQSKPAAAEFTSRRYMAFWLDEKNGVPELRSRRFGADLSPVGAEFPLFNDGLIRRPDLPVCQGNGRVAALAWQNGEPYAIRVAFVDSLGTVLLESTAGDVASPPFLGSPAVSAMANGGFVVTWEEFRLGWRVVGQLFDSAGASMGADLLLDGTSDSLLKASPAVAGDTSGGFCVAWSQGDDTRADVYVRCYDSLGVANGSALKVTTEISGESYMLPQVAYLPATHRYVLTYIQADLPADSTALWRCTVRPDGTVEGVPAALPAGPYPWSPSASVSAGRVMLFTERYDNLGQIRALAVNAAGAVVESTSVISGAVVRERLAVAGTSGSDTLFVVWQDRASGDFDVQGLRRSNGTTVTTERTLQSEGPGGQQLEADVAARLGLGVLVAYTDWQAGRDVTLVEVSEAGSILSRKRASDDTLLAPEYDPHIASAPSGWSFCTWTDERSDWPGAAVHAAGRFAQAGLFIGPSFPLSSSGAPVLQGQTDVAMRSNKFSSVVWIDDRSGTPRAFFRRFTDTGTPDGGEVPLEDGSQSQLLISFELDPAVAMDSTGTIWTAWTAFDVITDSYVLMLQAWTSTGVRRGTNRLPAVGPTAEPLDFDMAARGDGRLRLAWYDAEAASPVVKTAVFDTLGALVEGPTDVSAAPVDAQSPRVAIDATGRWVVSWSQSAGQSDDILWQRYEANNTPSALRETLSGAAPATRVAPAVAYSGNYVYGAWHDNETPGEGFDVRLSSLLKATSDVRDHDPVRPHGFALHPSFPNPFNGNTRISYALDHPAQVSLAVFDALGRRVRVLTEGEVWPGEHVVTWDGTDDRGRELGSGVYFCRLQAGPHAESRKLLYLK